MVEELTAHETAIPGLWQVNLPVLGDERGWFKENWQQAKLAKLGLPDFRPVQNNIAYNKERGVTRGIHAEPWDKFISLGHGEAFAAIVDLRPGGNFGKLETFTLSPQTAIYVPRGCGNAYQTLTADVVYTYLVNAHWSPEAKYTMLNLADETVAIAWPIPLDQATLSDKDKSHPRLNAVKLMVVS